MWLAGLAVAMVTSGAHARAAIDWAGCLRAPDLEERVDHCTDIIRDSPNAQVRIRALTGRGNALCATSQRCAEAIPDFASVVQLAPDVPGYVANYARALRAAARYDEALRANDRAITLAPQLAFVYLGKARTLEAAGREAAALQVVDTAITLAPADAGLWEYKGKLSGALKRYPEAYRAFDRALALQPRSPGVYVRRADVELAEGKLDAAIVDLQQYPPDGDEADQVRAKLRSLIASKADEAAEPDMPPVGRGVQSAEPGIVSPSPDPHSTAPNATDTASLRPGSTCNLYYWTPIAQCVFEYHTQNDPMPSGAPNPHRWNSELAAAGKAFAARHSDVPWDRTEWNAIAAKDAEETASEQAELAYHRKHSVPPDLSPDSAKAAPAPAASGEIAACDAPWILEYLKRSVLTPEKKLLLALQGISINDKATIAGIVQQDYDAANEHRRCTATLTVSSPVGLGGRPTNVSINLQYHIDRRLDGDHGSWATCDDCRFY